MTTKADLEQRVAEFTRGNYCAHPDAAAAHELADLTRDQNARIAELAESAHHVECLRNKQGQLLKTGDPGLDAPLQAPDPEFDALVASLPETYWYGVARYALSAVHVGWVIGKGAKP